MANTPLKSDITTLITQFETMSGFQRSNRFRISITPPAKLAIPKNIPIFAQTVQTPSQAILFRQDFMSPSGPPIDVPLRRVYDERFIVEFIIDGRWDIRKFFDGWMDFLFINSNPNTKNSTKVNYWEDVVGTFVIQALDINDNVKQTITLYDAWPKMIIPSQMSNDTPNQYLVLIVDINYRYYKLS